MRLIDADILEYTCNSDECGMLTGCNHCQYHIITEDEIDNAPTVDVLDKIRAEINKALSAETISDNNQQISDVGIGLELALSIIDKYKGDKE